MQSITCVIFYQKTSLKDCLKKNNVKVHYDGKWQRNWGRYGLQAFWNFSAWSPLILFYYPIIEYFKGNRDAVAYTKTYVSQWDSIKIVLPTNLYDFSSGEIPRRTKVLTGDGKQKQRIYASFEQYYITQYKKYFKIIWIVGGIDEIVGHYQRRHDAAGIQCQLMRPNMVLSVYVNRKQWKDKSYGTIEKPMPVFLHRIYLR